MTPTPARSTGPEATGTEALQQQSFWEAAWVRHLEAYLRSPPRCAQWLLARFPMHTLRSIEIAGGSCRDARHLAELGCDATGSDFDKKTLRYLAQRFPASRLKLAREDAMRFSAPDGAYDLSFHNGFWVLFPDDADLLRLLREQARITRRTLVVLVHNRRNRRLVRIFGARKRSDPLYDIRFFDPDELPRLLRQSDLAARVSIEKFGGPADGLLRLRRPAFLHGWLGKLVPRLYRWQPWALTERVACVIELQGELQGDVRGGPPGDRQDIPRGAPTP